MMIKHDKNSIKSQNNVTTALSIPQSTMDIVRAIAEKKERTVSFILRKLIHKSLGIADPPLIKKKG